MKGAEVFGIEGRTIEINVAKGRGLNIVGLNPAAAREMSVRVRSSLQRLGYDLSYDLTVTLTPPPLHSSSLDLAVAVAILEHQDHVPHYPYLLFAELGLDGTLREVRGSIACAELSDKIVVAPGTDQAIHLSSASILQAHDLNEVVTHLRGGTPLHALRIVSQPVNCETTSFADVRGQQEAKEALQEGANTHTNVLLIGPPGTGKTMLARRALSLFDPLDHDDALSAATINNAIGLHTSFDKHENVCIPFRAPHHTVSEAGLLGGGPRLLPGEVTLAAYGILFLDELPEFRRSVLEGLRQTLKAGERVFRHDRTLVKMPADPWVIAAMNPCPCGFSGTPRCSCTAEQVKRYGERIKPIVDLFPIRAQTEPVRRG